MAYSEASRPGVSNDQLSSPRTLYRLNLKINAIGSAVEELAIWGERQGLTDTSDAVKPHLDTLIENADFISKRWWSWLSRRLGQSRGSLTVQKASIESSATIRYSLPYANDARRNG
ncbi:hypothetical protein VST38_04165 [Pseudomonas aeruginosa]|uniref:hypothetical protein n=1 Tax=Pseudomonas aeruginosa TaxID=287 RepID=UPI003982C11F